LTLEKEMKIVVIGAGIWGSWTALLLRRSGYDVRLVDQFGPGNSLSGSGGETRIIRTVYGRNRIYTEMANDAFSYWEALFEESGVNMFHECGMLWLFQESTEYAVQARQNLKALGLTFESIPIVEAHRRFPIFNFSDIKEVFWEPRAGILEARKATKLVCTTFIKEGGTFSLAEVNVPEGQGRELRQITLSTGESLNADQYVFACGPWNNMMFQKYIGGCLYTSRQEVYFFKVPSKQAGFYQWDATPLWFDFNQKSKMYYGIPDAGGRGFKLAYDDRHQSFDPDRDDRHPEKQNLKLAREYLAFRFPGLKDAPLVEARVCQYENSLDEHFIMDKHPVWENVLILGGSSGHGFKMGPVIGRMVQDHIHLNIDMPKEFSLKRFTRKDQKTKTQ
jgi:sarcosine oxidase